jgi:hypothetical protein
MEQVVVFAIAGIATSVVIHSVQFIVQTVLLKRKFDKHVREVVSEEDWRLFNGRNKNL